MRKHVICNSTKDSFGKFCIVLITLSISVIASFLDNQALYITILVQSINNMFELGNCIDIKVYDETVHKMSFVAVITAILAFILSICALLNLNRILFLGYIKLIGTGLVVMPVYVYFYDYRVNYYYENIKCGIDDRGVNYG